MPSPVGHTLMGLSGYLFKTHEVSSSHKRLFLMGSIVLGNLADADIIPGIIAGHTGLYHHRMTHSVFMILLVGWAIAFVAGRFSLNRLSWGVWGGIVYGSHIFLDMLVNDPSPPLGVQLLWPLSKSFFIFPFRPFPRFDYCNAHSTFLGLVKTFFIPHNLITMTWEALIISPLVIIIWWIQRKRAFRESEPGQRNISRG